MLASSQPNGSEEIVPERALLLAQQVHLTAPTSPRHDRPGRLSLGCQAAGKIRWQAGMEAGRDSFAPPSVTLFPASAVFVRVGSYICNARRALRTAYSKRPSTGSRLCPAFSVQVCHRSSQTPPLRAPVPRRTHLRILVPFLSAYLIRSTHVLSGFPPRANGRAAPASAVSLGRSGATHLRSRCG